MIRSDSPPAYASALSKKLTPASSRGRQAVAARLGVELVPNVTHEPNDRTLTCRPVRPSRRYVHPVIVSFGPPVLGNGSNLPPASGNSLRFPTLRVDSPGRSSFTYSYCELFATGAQAMRRSAVSVAAVLGALAVVVAGCSDSPKASGSARATAIAEVASFECPTPVRIDGTLISGGPLAGRSCRSSRRWRRSRRSWPTSPATGPTCTASSPRARTPTPTSPSPAWPRCLEGRRRLRQRPQARGPHQGPRRAEHPQRRRVVELGHADHQPRRVHLRLLVPQGRRQAQPPPVDQPADGEVLRGHRRVARMAKADPANAAYYQANAANSRPRSTSSTS